MTLHPPLLVQPVNEGAIWRVVLSAPKGNILDIAMIEALSACFARAADVPALKAVILAGEGDHFSFGASVEDHQAGVVEEMLPCFHQMFQNMLDASVFTLAVVRGQCLGGGLELASFCHRVIAAPNAKLGQPEIALGVFAPVASFFLPERIGRVRAEDLCLTGRVVGAEQALAMGLVDEVADDPESAAQQFVTEHLLPRSGTSLRFAVRAARLGISLRFATEIGALERLFLDELMATDDANEGITSFLERRAPSWGNR